MKAVLRYESGCTSRKTIDRLADAEYYFQLANFQVQTTYPFINLGTTPKQATAVLAFPKCFERDFPLLSIHAVPPNL